MFLMRFFPGQVDENILTTGFLPAATDFSFLKWDLAFDNSLVICRRNSLQKQIFVVGFKG